MTAFQFARRHAQLIARIGGGLLVLVGVLEVTGAWNAALLWLQAALARQLLQPPRNTPQRPARPSQRPHLPPAPAPAPSNGPTFPLSPASHRTRP